MPNSATIPTVGRTQATPTLYNNLANDVRHLIAMSGGMKTVASGVLTVNPANGEGFYAAESEGGAATDEIDTISGGATGDVIALILQNAAHVIKLKHNTGNLNLPDNADLTLSATFSVLLRFDGSKWLVMGGSGGSSSSQMTNRSGTAVAVGDVVVFNTSYDYAFQKTTYLRDKRVCGVVLDALADTVTGRIATVAGTIVDVNCDTAAVARGQYLITSTTAGRATGGGYIRQPGTFAIAMTSKVGGSTGTVKAMLIDNASQALPGTAGYSMGGFIAAESTTSQKLTMATGTWAVVAGAALPAAIKYPAGFGDTTVRAYAIAGSTSVGVQATAYGVAYATDTSSTISSANVATARHNLRPIAVCSLRGYVLGGYTTGVVNECDKITLSTSTRAALGANLSSARDNQAAVSDGTYMYIGGGTAVTADRLTDSTGAVAAYSSANFASFAASYSNLNFPASAGYFCHNYSGTNLSRKLPFATGVNASLSSTLSSTERFGFPVYDGVAIGYVSSNAGSDKFTLSTETYASDSGSVMPTNISMGAAASYNAL